MPDCIIAMKTRTSAEHAKRIASGMRIRADIVSVDPSVTKRGCAFGLRLSCADSDELRSVLDRRGISYGDVLGR